MSRIKRLLLVLCALLPVMNAAAAQELIDGGAIVPETANYRTSEVVRGDYIQTFSSGASEIYPVTYRVRYDGVTARFVDYLVRKGDYVEEGDVLAILEADVSTVSLFTMELNLQRARERYEVGTLQRREAMTQKQQALGAAADVYAREQVRLELEKMRLELEMYQYDQERAIQRQEEALRRQQEEYAETVLRAPASGYITDLVYFKEGEPIYDNVVMASMESHDTLLLRIKNEQQKFRYNMPVTVETGVAKTRTTLTGRVVATDQLLMQNKRWENVAYVLLDNVGDIQLRNSQAHCEPIVVRDVLLLPRAALTLEKGSYFVSKLDGETVAKRFVNALLTNIQQTWLLQGLEEGELVILD